jgi:hypothetical protein
VGRSTVWGSPHRAGKDATCAQQNRETLEAVIEEESAR